MKILPVAALAAVLTAGLAASAGAATPRCGCPVVHHHPVHRTIRRETVYHHGPYVEREAPVAYDEPVYDEPDYGSPPPVVYDDWPAYYGVPYGYGYGGFGYYGGPGWHGGWGHGYRGGFGGGHFGGGHFGGGHFGGGHFGGGHRR